MSLWLKNFGSSGGLLPVLEFTATGISSASQSTYSFTNRNLGVATTDRLVVVAVEGANNGGSVSSCSIGGNPATEIIDRATSGASAIYALVVPTGTTATVSVTFTTGQNQAFITVYTIKNLKSSTVRRTATATGNNPSTTIDVEAGGIVIAGALTLVAGSATWTGLTENSDQSGTVSTATAASAQFLSPQTALAIQTTFTSNNTSSIVAACWR